MYGLLILGLWAFFFAGLGLKVYELTHAAITKRHESGASAMKFSAAKAENQLKALEMEKQVLELRREVQLASAPATVKEPSTTSVAKVVPFQAPQSSTTPAEQAISAQAASAEQYNQAVMAWLQSFTADGRITEDGERWIDAQAKAAEGFGKTEKKPRRRSSGSGTRKKKTKTPETPSQSE